MVFPDALPPSSSYGDLMKIHRLRSDSRILFMLIVSALLASSCSASKTAAPEVSSVTASWASVPESAAVVLGTSPANIPARPNVPSPPAAMAIADGDAAVQIATLVEATEAGAPQSDAAWLAVYDYAKIPVLGSDQLGVGTTGDDPVGPPWWAVWMFSSPAKGQGMRLSDAMRMIMPLGDKARSLESGVADAASLIADLSVNLQSGDPAVTFAIAFLDAKLTSLGTASSIFDPKFEVASSTIDTATTQFLGWVVMRSFLATADVGPSPTNGFRASQSLRQPATSSGGGSFSCSSLLGTDQATFVANWIVNKVAGGVSLPGGVNLPSLIETYAKLLSPTIGGEETAARRFQRYSSVTGAISVMTSALALALQYENMHVESAANELIRTKSTSDGARADIEIAIVSSPPTPDPNSKAACALSVLGNIAGISLTLPPKGGLSGVDVTVKGGRYFGERVLFANLEKQGRQVSNEAGIVVVGTLGKAQKKSVPDSAKEEFLKYTIKVSATPEALDGNSMFNIFFDSLVAVGTANTAAAAGVVIDLVKVTSWDLGEIEAPLTDWKRPESYTVDGFSGQVAVSGRICSLSEPFSLLASVEGIAADIAFTPTGENTGTYMAVFNFPSDIRVTFDGAWTATTVDPAGLTIEATAGDATSPFGGGSINSGAEAPVRLIPLDPGC